ncbi:hypothetical protein TNCV_4287781 [Trichonephila clavipes]|uniref:Uncharacterized protein n=1 Tax=Trichonephila clavipes TaxID=2585209 RepID=A0A8X6SEP1_TRICX|nr:hypothetical protein TNCV_4287781 [Trichonephila clavipes]
MPVPSVEDLIIPTFVVAVRIPDIPGIFPNVGNSKQPRSQACQAASPFNMLLFLFLFSASLHHSSQLPHFQTPHSYVVPSHPYTPCKFVCLVSKHTVQIHTK